MEQKLYLIFLSLIIIQIWDGDFSVSFPKQNFTCLYMCIYLYTAK